MRIGEAGNRKVPLQVDFPFRMGGVNVLPDPANPAIFEKYCLSVRAIRVKRDYPPTVKEKGLRAGLPSSRVVAPFFNHR
jgi:hypothetical protein